MKYVIESALLLIVLLLTGCGSGKGAAGSGSTIPDNHLRASSISAGGTHTCANTSSSTMCWGSNGGSFGDGSTANSLLPVSISFNGIQMGKQSVQMDQTVAWDGHSCGIRNGVAYCWGNNEYGCQGDGTTNATTEPTAVIGMDADVTAIVTGTTHTCGIKAGALYCWGLNSDGELGDGTTTDSLIPVAVSDMGSDVTAVSVGQYHTCAIKAGDVYCWGAGGNGRVGDGDTSNHNVLSPTQVAGLSSATSIVSGSLHTCVLLSGVIKCFGNDGVGQLGGGLGGPAGHAGIDSTGTPTTVSTLINVTQIASGVDFMCALDSGNIYCWGANSYGNIGIGSDAIGVDQYTPQLVSSLIPPPPEEEDSAVQVVIPTTADAKSVSVGLNTVCVITSDDSVMCWGNNQDGQVGDGTTDNQALPVFTLEGEE